MEQFALGFVQERKVFSLRELSDAKADMDAEEQKMVLDLGGRIIHVLNK